MPTRTSPLTPQYGWNDRAGRYVRLTAPGQSRFVSASEIQKALNQVIDASAQHMTDLAVALRDGRLTLSAWETAMQAEIKMVHLASAATARGGWAQLTQADYGRVGARVRVQLGYLRDRAKAIQAGTQALDGTLIARARLYAGAARGTRHAFERLEMSGRGYTQERNVLNSAEHCSGCTTETGRGWVAIGQLVPIGARLCIANCKCSIEYRKSGALG